MGETGPCGRCSEIYYVRGGSGHDPEIEVWNNVFMEFERSADGTLTPLPAPCIDTGMGLERVTAVLQGKQSNYDTDLFTPLLARIGEMRGLKYGDDETRDISMRVVADHTRAMTFLIGDGVVPSNEWRGYVLRKIMRRAMRHGKHLGIREPFLHSLVDTMVAEFGGAYPELTANRESIARVIRSEEERFDAVLTDGLPKLEDVLDQAAAAGGVVPGEAAFRLYDTFGIPRDFIEDMIETRKLQLDVAGFDAAMEAQRSKARAQSAFKGGAAKDAAWTASDATRAVARGGRRGGVPRLRPHRAEHADSGRLRRRARRSARRSPRARRASSRCARRRSISKPAARSPTSARSRLPAERRA